MEKRFFHEYVIFRILKIWEYYLMEKRFVLYFDYKALKFVHMVRKELVMICIREGDLPSTIYI
jgi:hypothetical protein